jgi:hypothetical protein
LSDAYTAGISTGTSLSWLARDGDLGLARRDVLYAGDREEPPQIHVERDVNVARFWIDRVRLVSSGGFRPNEIRHIQRLVQEHCTEDTLTVELSDGRSLSVPLAWYPRLVHGTSDERSNWRLVGQGLGGESAVAQAMAGATRLVRPLTRAPLRSPGYNYRPGDRDG